MTNFENRRNGRRVLVAHNLERGGQGGAARMMETSHAALEAFGWTTEYFTASDMPASANGRYKRYAFSWYVRDHVRKAFLRGEAYDVVNIHEPSGTALVLGRERIGSPVVVAMSHGLEQRYWELRLKKNGAGLDRPGMKERVTFPLLSLWQSRLTLRKADHVFCLNEEDRNFLQNRFHVLSEKITRVIPGAGPEFSAIAPKRSYDRACTKILFSGTWIERKGIRQVAEAFSDLAARHPALQLGILGAGIPAARVLADFSGEFHSRITVLPGLDHAGCAEVLLDYDIFLLPSFYEGTPLALIEAMYTGIPVITSATCGMKDVVEDGRTGLMVTPGNSADIVRCVDLLVKDASLRQRLGRAASAEATQKYTWQATAERMHLAYSKLAHQAKSRTPQGLTANRK
jgi:glycosyltransferase involved in cell wall biosynthesis